MQFFLMLTFVFLFQSTLLREERRTKIWIDSVFPVISIHAPTRGATDSGINIINQVRLFQSTLLREERRAVFFSKIPSNIISIHAPTRGATAFVNSLCICVDISIHAPTRGATHPFHPITVWLLDFNPRSYERSDFAMLGTIMSTNPFQSTLLREERLHYQRIFLIPNIFQSTLLREERRQLINASC